MKRHHLPSVAVALIDDQDVIWHGVFGLANVEQELPGTTDTVYRLWSVSKVLTAIETMRLVEEGLVGLLPSMLLLSFVTSRLRNATSGLIAHSILNGLGYVVIPLGILGLSP